MSDKFVKKRGVSFVSTYSSYSKASRVVLQLVCTEKGNWTNKVKESSHIAEYAKHRHRVNKESEKNWIFIENSLHLQTIPM